MSPCAKALPELFGGETFTAIKLGEALTNPCYELNFLSDFHEGRFFGQFLEQIDDYFFAAHGITLLVSPCSARGQMVLIRGCQYW